MKGLLSIGVAGIFAAECTVFWLQILMTVVSMLTIVLQNTPKPPKLNTASSPPDKKSVLTLRVCTLAFGVHLQLTP